MILILFCNGVTHGYCFLTFLNVITAPLVIFHQIDKYFFPLKMKLRNSISIVTEEKYQGVIFEKDLKFTPYVNQIVTKANRVLGIIKRTFASRDANTIRSLYVTLVRPILDYASTVWNPTIMKKFQKLEAVQRRTTKLITSFHNLTYSERLQKLNFPSLLHRRTRMDLTMTYKILNNLVAVEKDYFLLLIPTVPDLKDSHFTKVILILQLET